MTLTVLIALAWLVFLAGFLVGCAWANAVARPTDLRPQKPELTIGKDMISCPLPKVPQDLSRHFLPESPNGTALKPIIIRHNTDPGARN